MPSFKYIKGKTIKYTELDPFGSHSIDWDNCIHDMIYLTAIGLTPGGSSTVHIYTQTIHEQHNGHKTIHRTTQLIHALHIT